MAASSDPEVERTQAGISPASVTEPSDVGEDVPPVLAGRYRIVDRLGQGGMATVWLARDDELERDVAVKVVRAHRNDATQRTRMLREAQTLARMSHPNVVQIFDVGVAGDSVYLAMERVQGLTLDQWREQRRPAWPRVLAAYTDVARALAAVHREGLVHRDFKPSNVMIDEEGRVRLIDFGLARNDGATQAGAPSPPTGPTELVDQDAVDLTRSGTVMGTPAYMSPEQARGEVVTAASDQFSFCVALFEAAHGQRPFRGDSYATLVKAICSGSMEPVALSVPRRLHEVIVTGLAVDPTARYPSMDALVEALSPGRANRGRAWLAGLGLTALTMGLASPLLSQDAGQCNGTTVSEVYNDAVAFEIRDVLQRSGMVYASDTADRVHARLSASAAGWTDAWAEVCDDRVAPRLRDAARSCLQSAREGLAEAVASLGNVEAGTIERATGIVANLVDPATCVRARDVVALPPEHRDAIEAFRGQIRRASNARAAGDPAAAVAQTQEVLAAARTLGVPEFLAEAALAHGRSLDSSGDDRGAAALFEEAYNLGVAHRPDDLAGRAALSALDARIDLNELDVADRWAGHARAELERREHPSELDAALWEKRSMLQQRRAQYEQAEQSLREAIAILERGDATDDARLAVAYDHLGNVLENLNRHEEAIAEHERALAMFEQANGPQHPSVGRALANLGNATAALDRRQSAAEYFGRAHAILLAAYGPHHQDVGSALQGRGVAAMDLGELDEARAYLSEAHAIHVANGGEDDPHAAIPLGNLGGVEMLAERYDDAEGHYRRAHDIYARQLGDDHPWTALMLANLARVDAARGDHRAAIDKYDRAMTTFSGASGSRALYLAMVLNNRATEHLAVGQTDTARGDFRRAHEILGEVYGPTDPRVGSPLLNLAALELKLGEVERAREHARAVAALWTDAKAPTEAEAAELADLLARLTAG